MTEENVEVLLQLSCRFEFPAVTKACIDFAMESPAVSNRSKLALAHRNEHLWFSKVIILHFPP